MPNPRARALRQNMTEPERKLWYELRRRNLGARFRRQAPLGPFIVDFVCFERRIVIEVDGASHAERTNYDSTRTEYLEGHGYRVLRFWNNDVMGNIEGVMTVIAGELDIVL